LTVATKIKLLHISGYCVDSVVLSHSQKPKILHVIHHICLFVRTEPEKTWLGQSWIFKSK